ncbi:hypothetical protein BAJUN_00260 [Bajunvirus bajun]|uniref:Transmembrane protein n=1 Tax=Brevundimonas phage vB_BgoS-Bajun TaxID=2948594 RepID=A0A9E7N7G5_9CAUD|nr:hypothetical protein BAJUN_00260 [Brevundimonas phage vB_BgoS-Bajun]
MMGPVAFFLAYIGIGLAFLCVHTLWGMWNGWVKNRVSVKRWLGRGASLAWCWPITFLAYLVMLLMWATRGVPDQLASLGRRVHSLNPKSRN